MAASVLAIENREFRHNVGTVPGIDASRCSCARARSRLWRGRDVRKYTSPSIQSVRNRTACSNVTIAPCGFERFGFSGAHTRHRGNTGAIPVERGSVQLRIHNCALGLRLVFRGVGRRRA